MKNAEGYLAFRIFFVFVKFAESDCVFIFLDKWLQLAKKIILRLDNCFDDMQTLDFV